MSAEQGTMNDGVTRLSEASFARDWGSAEDRVYDPTTKLSEQLHSYALNLTLWTDDAKLDELAALLHLAASQVEALEAELDGRIAEDSVLCPHAPNHVLEGKLRELEEVNTNLARRILDLEADKHEADDAATH